ncbi:MAG: sulfite reductase [Acidobacteria bacterium]|nr:sulfite reductase [Acidobacteriota bacterium]NIQ30444.1 sulfite reductase [Acidobacteriota bacterium]
MKAVIAREDVGRLLAIAARRDELHVPVLDGGGGRFVPLNAEDPVPRDGLMLNGSSARRPPKEVLFAQTAPLFAFELRRGDFSIDELPPEAATKVLFGVRPCDGRGFRVLDSLLLGKCGTDPAYASARQGSVLVGIGCGRPGSDCFCTSVGGDPHGTDGLDVLATDLGDALHLESLTDGGEGWLRAIAAAVDSPLTPANPETDQRCREAHEEARGRVPRHVDLEPLDAVLERAFDDELWDDLAAACIGCGACTFLCPTCRCFDVQDEVRGDRGLRVRVWDSCMFREYTQEAGGHNPRPRRGMRWRNRFYDKFRWGAHDGQPACVGCGRCITHCPSGVDLIDLVERVVESGGAA